MYDLNHDAFDNFAADFTQKESILKGKHYPLGFFAAEALDLEGRKANRILPYVLQFEGEFRVFLSARTHSSAAVAHDSIMKLWSELEKYPVYNELLSSDRRVDNLLPYLRDHPEAVTEMLTPGTGINQAYERWRSKLHTFDDEFAAFHRNTIWMLDEYFMSLRFRRVENYARAFGSYKRDIGRAMEIEAETGEKDATVDLETVQLSYPMRVSFTPQRDPATNTLVLAEGMTFETLASFLFMDLYKGMAAGNLPRRCEHCNRWFVSVGAYNTLYCNRVAPDASGKTCREIGAHEKEKENRKGAGAEEYYRTYNRLKARKQRGKISVNEWNKMVVRAQVLRTEFEDKIISEEQYIKTMKAL